MLGYLNITPPFYFPQAKVLTVYHENHYDAEISQNVNAATQEKLINTTIHPNDKVAVKKWVESKGLTTALLIAAFILATGLIGLGICSMTISSFHISKEAIIASLTSGSVLIVLPLTAAVFGFKPSKKSDSNKKELFAEEKSSKKLTPDEALEEEKKQCRNTMRWFETKEFILENGASYIVTKGLFGGYTEIYSKSYLT